VGQKTFKDILKKYPFPYTLVYLNTLLILGPAAVKYKKINLFILQTSLQKFTEDFTVLALSYISFLK